ncbi:MAG: UDP-2,3-diacylglucosamine diphosphatase [Gammaproteobacteria bacterium]|nr:UDP-2,3-diacylglucosamine diphosphatase [Gammaproteobacteria bacterium]
MTFLFVSDLHLDPSEPGIAAQFIEFLAGEARSARALYVLGDLFEAWLGDDDPEPAHAMVAAALESLSSSGVAVFLMQGNRDVMMGERFAGHAGATLLPDPVITEIHGERVLITHGDALCTDDASYQRLRSLLRDPDIHGRLARLPIDSRRALASEARAGSRDHVAHTAYEVMDVNADAVASVLRASGASVLLHGHTHRPAIHELRVDGRACRRIVLGDWHAHGSVLRWDAKGPRLEVLPRG